MRLAESGEMYLETILRLSEKKERVRSIDVADEMGFSKPSVSRAVGLLKNNGLISVDGLGSITLTDKGRAVAEKTYERHIVLSELLERLGVSRETAVSDACKMEHVISDETFEAIKRHQAVYGAKVPKAGEE